MNPCKDLLDKWRTEPNFCGYGPAAAKTIDRYIILADELKAEYGLEEAIIYKNVPCSSVKTLLKFTPGSDLRTFAIKKISEAINGGHSVTAKYVNSLLGLTYTPRLLKKICPFTDVPTHHNKQCTICERSRTLSSILTPKRITKLRAIMTGRNLCSEYETLCFLIDSGNRRLKHD